VLRDKEPLNPASWNHALPIDGGTYTITARAPGRTPWNASRTIKVEGDTVVVDIPKLPEVTPVATVRPPAGTPPAQATRPVPPPAAVTARPQEPPTVAQRAPSSPSPVAPSPPEPAPEPAEAPRGGRSLAIPLVVGGAAVALGIGGIVLEIQGRDLYDQAKRITDQARQKDRDDKESSANVRHRLAQGLGVAALGCAGVVVYMLVRDRGEDRAGATALAPMVAPQLAGLALSGSW
ncbi:MAG TPA: hypothetical protein VLM79_05260, partial [Kofleriaceae bacterium]|nr:hypothetical protein [Kofleriaceae bacterium]